MSTQIGWVRTNVTMGYNMAVTESGQPVLACDVLPDSPALPRIAEWLAEHPEAAEALDRLIEECDSWGTPYLHFKADVNVLRALVAALAGEPTDTEDDR